MIRAELQEGKSHCTAGFKLYFSLACYYVTWPKQATLASPKIKGWKNKSILPWRWRDRVNIFEQKKSNPP